MVTLKAKTSYVCIVLITLGQFVPGSGIYYYARLDSVIMRLHPYGVLCLQGTQGKFDDARIQKRARVLHWHSIAVHYSERDLRIQ
jgi:hypothetical protein